MKIYKKILFITVFTLVSFSVFPIEVKAQKQINYTFNDEILIESDNIPFESNYNTRNPQSFTNTYNATYSFTNDTDYGNPSNFTIDETGGSVNVFPSLDNHDKVLELNDTDNVELCTAFQFFDLNITFGTIEYFVRIDNADKKNGFLIRDYDNLTLCGINIENDVFKYLTDIGTWLTTGLTILDNTWYHISFDFECTSGNYKGLTQYYYQFRINGIKYGEYEFYLYQPNAENIRIYTANVDVNYKVYYDAIGYSWDDSYSINDNVVPFYTTNTSIIEKDKFQFDMKGTNEFYIDDDPIINWTILGGTPSFINNYPLTETDRYFRIHHTTTVASPPKETGFYYTFNSTANRINASIRMFFLEFDVNSWYEIEIFSSDSTKILEIQIQYFYTDGYAKIYYLTPTSSLIEFGNEIYLNDIVDLNLFIDYNSELCTIRYKLNDILENVSICQPLVSAKNGILYLKLFNLYNAFQADPRLTTATLSAGVYGNGLSIVGNNDFAYVGFELGINQTTTFQKHNIFDIITSGLIEASLYYGQLGQKNIEITPKILFNNTNFKGNTYNGITDTINNPKLFFFFKGTLIEGNFTVDYCKISGSSLIESGNKHWLEFDYGNVDINDNYFYVDSSNRLQFNLISNDDGLEYIQATFNINDVNSTNRFLSFKSNLFGSNIGTFRIEFTDISNIFTLEKLDMSYYHYISQEKVVNKFVLLITDNDLTNKGSTTGYFSMIKLRYSTIETTIITLTVISLIIPLIMILLPSIAISNIYSKVLLVPLFILFTIITSISGLIPYWLLFIILYNTIIFMYLKQKEFSESFE